jgi:hypothetical protein
MSSDANGGQTPISNSLISFVAQSPQLCAAHDKAGWVALFARDGQINDPVGSKPHDGHAAISRFYDTFIAPNALKFDVERDFVSGMSVMRDLTLTSTMATGLAIPVPMHLRYDLVVEDGALKIHRLYAIWELPVLLRQQLGSFKGWVTSMQLTPQLLRHQGLVGLVGFMRGLSGVGDAGKRAALAHIAAAPEFAGAVVGKVLASGQYVGVTLTRYGQRGVALFRFDAGPEQISSVQIYG